MTDRGDDSRVERVMRASSQGAETMLSVDLKPQAGGCAPRLTHRGFYDQERADHHGKSREQILAGLDKRLMA